MSIKQIYVYEWVGRYIAFYSQEAAAAFVKGLDRDPKDLCAVPIIDSAPLDGPEDFYFRSGEKDE